MMKSDPDQFLNRLVVATLTIFVTVSLLLAAVVFREIWLQQHIAELSSDLQVNLDDLKQTTEVIQSDLSTLLTTTLTTDETQSLPNLNEVTELLSTVDEQLTSIEEEVNKVATILESDSESVLYDPTPAVMQDRADRVFTIFAVLISIAAIAVAILLGVAMRVQSIS
ncbi:MAG: hypothetical protein KF832_18720 [Caldilineaceae bacterium]|nr:hypothetical protein [Caldilineaceae bacterium]